LTTISCPAPYGVGGLGRHFAQLVESARRAGSLAAYYTPRPKDSDSQGHAIPTRIGGLAVRLTPLRLSPGWRTFVVGGLFDGAVARRLGETERHLAFSGHAIRTFRATKGAQHVLVSPTAHVNLVSRQFAMASNRYRIESTWLNEAGRQRALAEYEQADVIQVSSDYARRSFVEAGVAPEKLEVVELEIPTRFAKRVEPIRDGVFRVLYVGSLTVAKGVPVLVDAFSQLSGAAELVLVGGWATRGMRRYLQARMAVDDRIVCVTGDPLSYLRRASVLVHPSFSDGFGYAPMEALACGVPVVVTEDTGMSQHVEDGVNGFVVATGDEGAVIERLDHLRRTTSSGGALAN
jgi:glycosyltransferase involved in cell wall biosynthesis